MKNVLFSGWFNSWLGWKKKMKLGEIKWEPSFSMAANYLLSSLHKLWAKAKMKANELDNLSHSNVKLINNGTSQAIIH